MEASLDNLRADLAEEHLKVLETVTTLQSSLEASIMQSNRDNLAAIKSSEAKQAAQHLELKNLLMHFMGQTGQNVQLPADDVQDAGAGELSGDYAPEVRTGPRAATRSPATTPYGAA